jgi:hypothetical protein
MTFCEDEGCVFRVVPLVDQALSYVIEGCELPASRCAPTNLLRVRGTRGIQHPLQETPTRLQTQALPHFGDILATI